MTGCDRKYMRDIRDEWESAEEYAKKSVSFKNTRPDVAKMYKEMAYDELKHADFLQQIGQIMMKETSPGKTLQKSWQNCISDLAHHEAAVRIMLEK